MYVTVHGHFYQPPRENPWTGRIPRHPGAAPFSDWNARIGAECYAPNGRSRVLDEAGRIEEIVNNYEWIHFDFGPTLLRWMSVEMPDAYASLLEADRRSSVRLSGHGNAVAQAYNHTILPLATYREKRTQILWGLRDFEHRFGRPSESIWLPETAIDEETLRVLIEFGLRYIVLAPHQARRIRPISGGAWTDASGGRIDPTRPYRIHVRSGHGTPAHIDAYFYDGPVSAAISFDHLLRSAEGLADRLQSAGRGTAPSAMVNVATDGEIYGHHEPFGDMCLAYLVTREGPLRGFRFINYGYHLEQHPPELEVELDQGEHGDGTSWSCAHGVARWKRDCGCSTGGKPGWNQRWRSPLRKGLERLRDRLLEAYITSTSETLLDPFAARDDYIDVLLRGDDAREAFLARHARRSLSDREEALVWRMLEAQHQSMLMFTSCAWFFADVSGIEVQQNLCYAARAIELAQPYTPADLEDLLLSYLAEAKSNIPAIGSGADVWARYVRPQAKRTSAFALEAAAALAARGSASGVSSPAVSVSVDGAVNGNLRESGIRATITVVDRGTCESARFAVKAERDDKTLLRLEASRIDPEVTSRPPGVEIATALDLPDEIQAMVIRELLKDILAREAERFDAIFESSRFLLESYGRRDPSLLPPIFHALASDVVNRRIRQAAETLSRVTPASLGGTTLRDALGDLMSQAGAVGVEPDSRSVAALVELALSVQLAQPPSVTSSGIEQCLSLIRICDSDGIKIQRTHLEEMVYALLNHHRYELAQRLSGQTVSVQTSGIDLGLLIQLAEQSNLSLRSFERAPVQCAT